MIALGFKLLALRNLGGFFPFFMVFWAFYLVTWGGRKLYGEKVILQWCLSAHDASIFTISKSVLTDGMLFLFLNGALLFYYLGYSTPQKSITTGCMSAQP